MRSHLVEDMLHDLAQAISRILGIFEPMSSSLQEIFTLLGLEFDAEDVSGPEFQSLLHGTPGVPQQVCQFAALGHGLSPAK